MNFYAALPMKHLKRINIRFNKYTVIPTHMGVNSYKTKVTQIQNYRPYLSTYFPTYIHRCSYTIVNFIICTC